MTEDQADAAECGCCGRDLAEQERGTCTRCVGKTRADLHGIVNAYALLPGILHNPLGSNAPRRDTGRGNEKPMPGGDALVYAAGGGDGRGQLREAHFGDDDQAGDPVSVPYELGRWTDDWRRIRHEPAALDRYFVSSESLYLLEHLGWAASRHPEFPDFAGDVRRLRRLLEQVTGTSNRPMVAPAPCLDCGGQLVREYREVNYGRAPEFWGLDDDWTCAACGEVFDTGPDGRYMRAVAQMIHDRAEETSA